MPNTTSNMGLHQGIDGDNSKTLIETHYAADATVIDTHDHSTDAKGLSVSRITTGTTINNANLTGTPVFGAGVIANASLAALTQSIGPTVGTTNGPTYAVTSFATIPEMSVTLTTTGGELDVDMIVAITHSTTTMASFYGFSLDGAAEVGQSIGTILGAAGDHQLIHLFWTFSGVGAGSHTVTGRWKVGSDTVTAAGTQRWIRLIERKK